jgi:hypothetical protein
VIEGDYYPNLRYTQIEPYNVVIQYNYSAPRDWLDSQARYMTDQRAVPGVRITMPLQDWEAIMEIYKTHFHAENTNPGVKQAWEQYKIMCAMTRL